MFDTTIENNTTEVVAVTRVIEKSITPDRVTDMYDKVRDEVLSQIIVSYVIESTIFNGVVIYQYHPHTMTYMCTTSFTINGKKFLYDYPIRDFYTSEEKIIDEFVEKFKEALSNEILKTNINVIAKKAKSTNIF